MLLTEDSIPMASPPLEMGEPLFLTFLIHRLRTMIFDELRMCRPIWSSTPEVPTPTIVTLLMPLSSTSVAVVSQLPLTLVVLPWLMVPFTRMMIGVLTLARLQSAVLSCVPVLTVTVAPPAPPVVERPKPIGVPDGG